MLSRRLIIPFAVAMLAAWCLVVTDIRAEGTPGLTEDTLCLGGKSQVGLNRLDLSALVIGTYCFAVTVLTRLCPPSSARFPWHEMSKSKPVTPC